mgnify:CR=1 FL=1
MINEPQGAFMCLSSTLIVLSILARFVDYYSQFWGPVVIFTINELRGAFTCRSSTLTVLADDGPFHGLFLTVWGSRSDSTVNKTRVRLRVAHQHS